MEVKYPILLILYPLILAITSVIYYALIKPKKNLDKGNAARVGQLKKLPAYKKRVRRSKIIHTINLISLIVMTFGLTIVAARPIQTTSNPNNQKGLDVMIVLDASGSMTDYFQGVGKSIRDIVSQFKTDRLGFVVFSGESQTVLPLTDDYTEILSVADYLRDNHPSDFKYHYAYGVRGGTDIASGLHLASARMSNISDERTKVILMISDGEQTSSTKDDPDGTAEIDEDSVRAAAKNIASKNIKIYSLATTGDGAIMGINDGKDLLEDLATITSGAVYDLESPASTEEVFSKINDSLRSSVDSGNITATYETPATWLYISLISFACFLISSALRIEGGLL